MKYRLFEVVLWIAGIAAASALFVTITVIPALYADGETEGAFIVTAVALLIGVSVLGSLWVGNYIIYGQKKELRHILGMVWGKLPKYFWFIVSALYIGGILNAFHGTASDAALWFNDFAGGVGAALALLMLGAIGRLYRPNKFLGHVVGTSIIGGLALISLFFSS